MATDAYIGDSFVFQVLYYDSGSLPVAVTNPTITLFVFDPVTGDRILLVDADTMNAVVPSDPGRYVYRWTIPTSLSDGAVMYADYRATVVDTGTRASGEDTFNIKSRAGYLGLRARFLP